MTACHKQASGFKRVNQCTVGNYHSSVTPRPWINLCLNWVSLTLRGTFMMLLHDINVNSSVINPVLVSRWGTETIMPAVPLVFGPIILENNSPSPTKKSESMLKQREHLSDHVNHCCCRRRARRWEPNVFVGFHSTMTSHKHVVLIFTEWIHFFIKQLYHIIKNHRSIRHLQKKFPKNKNQPKKNLPLSKSNTYYSSTQAIGRDKNNWTRTWMIPPNCSLTLHVYSFTKPYKLHFCVMPQYTKILREWHKHFPKTERRRRRERKRQAS